MKTIAKINFILLCFVTVFCSIVSAQPNSPDITWDTIPNGSETDLVFYLGDANNQGPWYYLSFDFEIPIDQSIDSFPILTSGGILGEWTFTSSESSSTVNFTFDPGGGFVEDYGMIATVGGGALLTDVWNDKKDWITVRRIERSAPPMNLNIWPNPTSGGSGACINWELDRGTAETVWLMDLQGNRIPVDPTPGKVQLQGLAPGLYFLTVQGSEGVISRKFLIQ